MDLTQARQEFARSLEAAPDAADPLGAARRLLLARGAAALELDPTTVPGLADIVDQMARAPASPARRVFAVLLMDALAVPHLLSARSSHALPARSSQARLDRAIHALLESALPDVLRRGGYPFSGDLDAKRRSLTKLSASIDDYLRPPEPTFPAWLSGLPER